ncbi:hypothetical protein FOZ61_009809 [Perkinsus olseni]|uniref:Uncharacterized protein n=1 Tax=Perkinsus olseni TaxID=32597 RepID=A0A7J6KZE2_PEROL|nr:hypothetical protein FOZ61_009809 [Perkinsus olseni]
MSTSAFVTGVLARVEGAIPEDLKQTVRAVLGRIESARLSSKFTESLNDLVEKRLMEMVSDKRATGEWQVGGGDDIDSLNSNPKFVLPFLEQLVGEYQRGNWPKKTTALTVNMGADNIMLLLYRVSPLMSPWRGTIVSGVTGAQRVEKEAELLAISKGAASSLTVPGKLPVRGRFWTCDNCSVRNSGTAVLCASCGREQVSVGCHKSPKDIEALIHSMPTGMAETEAGAGSLTVSESPDKGWWCEICNKAILDFKCKSCGSTMNNRIRNGRRPRLKPGQWECWGAECGYINYKQHTICRKCGRDKNVEEDDTWPDKRQVPDPAHRLQLRTFVYTKLVQVFEPLDPLLDAPQKEFDFAAERLKTEALKAFMKRGIRGLQECDPLCDYFYNDSPSDNEEGSDTAVGGHTSALNSQWESVEEQLRSMGFSEDDIRRAMKADRSTPLTAEEAINFIFN